MSEFEDKINAILGNPAEMEKITKLAAQIMGGGGAASSSPEAPQEPPHEKPQETPGFDLGGIDPELFGKIGRLLSQAGGGSDKTALLRAMGPYLSQDRRERMEKAMRFAKIAKLAGAAIREYGGEHV